jgi:hypothetical protein
MSGKAINRRTANDLSPSADCLTVTYMTALHEPAATSMATPACRKSGGTPEALFSKYETVSK